MKNVIFHEYNNNQSLHSRFIQITFLSMSTFSQSRVERIWFGCILEKESVSSVTVQVVGDAGVSNSSVMVWLGMEGHGVQGERVGGMYTAVFAAAVLVWLLYCEFFRVSNHLCCELSVLHSGFQSSLTVLHANIE